jgi:hypothetical protein
MEITFDNGEKLLRRFMSKNVTADVVLENGVRKYNLTIREGHGVYLFCQIGSDVASTLNGEGKLPPNIYNALVAAGFEE